MQILHIHPGWPTQAYPRRLSAARHRSLRLLLIIFLLPALAFAQQAVSGSIIDSDDFPLVGGERPGQGHIFGYGYGLRR